MSSLYELAAEFRAIAEKLESSELDEQTIADTLEGYSVDLENKVISVCQFIRNLESTAEAIKASEAEQAKRRKAIEAKADRLREYVMNNMAATDKTKVECPLFSISIRTNPPSVNVFDFSAIPQEFLSIPEVAPVPNKKAIKAALEAGAIVSGCELQRSKSLSIK